MVGLQHQCDYQETLQRLHVCIEEPQPDKDHEHLVDNQTHKGGSLYHITRLEYPSQNDASLAYAPNDPGRNH